MTLPAFDPVPINELRALYRQYHENEDLRRLILELQRARDRFVEIEGYYEAIDRAWKEDVGGQLVALYKLRCLLQEERWRWGGML